MVRSGLTIIYIFFNLNENMLLFGGKKIIVTNSAANKCNENVVLILRSSQPMSDLGIIERGGSKSRMGGIRSFFSLAFGTQQKHREKLLVVDVSTCFHYNLGDSFN